MSNKQKVMRHLSDEFISFSELAKKSRLTEEQAWNAVRGLQYLDDLKVAVITKNVRGCKLIS